MAFGDIGWSMQVFKVDPGTMVAGPDGRWVTVKAGTVAIKGNSIYMVQSDYEALASQVPEVFKARGGVKI